MRAGPPRRWKPSAFRSSARVRGQLRARSLVTPAGLPGRARSRCCVGCQGSGCGPPFVASCHRLGAAAPGLSSSPRRGRRARGLRARRRRVSDASVWPLATPTTLRVARLEPMLRSTGPPCCADLRRAARRTAQRTRANARTGEIPSDVDAFHMAPLRGRRKAVLLHELREARALHAQKRRSARDVSLGLRQRARDAVALDLTLRCPRARPLPGGPAA